MNTNVSKYIIELVEKLNKNQKQLIWYCVDLLSFTFSVIVSYILFYSQINPDPTDYVIYVGVMFALYATGSRIFKLSSNMSRYNSIQEFLKQFFAILVSSLLSYGICYTFLPKFSFRFIVLFILLGTALVFTPRIIWQLMYSNRDRGATDEGNKRRAFLIGAGDGGATFMNNYNRSHSELDVVGILDIDTNKMGQKISGVEVLGSYEALMSLAPMYRVKEVVVAIPSLAPTEYERILEMGNRLGVKVFKMPKVEDVMQGRYLGNRKKIDISDLLGRKEIKLDEDKSERELKGKTIIITGAGGSIGSEICRQVSRFNPKQIVLLGHGENSIYLIYHELLRAGLTCELVPVIADIQDYARVLQVFKTYQPDIVYHAAAHKHVPMMERNPKEAYKNNILGTYNVAKAVDAAKVPKMVMISTDKAVNPPNVMGATKRIAELIVTGFNQQSQSTYCAVRFGNVLGSRGSVIPVFERQIAAGGPVTVTDFRMTRYFMTIPEASRLVIHAGSYARDGEVFILDMGEPVKIHDLARKMVLLSGHTESEIPIVEVGMRPGEKLYEELLVSSELIDEKVENEIFVGKVSVMSLDKITQVIESFAQYDGEELKTRIIQFANETTCES